MFWQCLHYTTFVRLSSIFYNIFSYYLFVPFLFTRYLSIDFYSRYNCKPATHSPLIKSQVLWPIELKAHIGTQGGIRTRRTPVLSRRCLPVASLVYMVCRAGFEPARPCSWDRDVFLCITCTYGGVGELASGKGFEPLTAGSEPTVLPLHYPDTQSLRGSNPH